MVFRTWLTSTKQIFLASGLVILSTSSNILRFGTYENKKVLVDSFSFLYNIHRIRGVDTRNKTEPFLRGKFMFATNLRLGKKVPNLVLGDREALLEATQLPPRRWQDELDQLSVRQN